MKFTFDGKHESAVIGESDFVVLRGCGVAKRSSVIRFVGRHHPQTKRHLVAKKWTFWNQTNQQLNQLHYFLDWLIYFLSWKSFHENFHRNYFLLLSWPEFPCYSVEHIHLFRWMKMLSHCRQTPGRSRKEVLTKKSFI